MELESQRMEDEVTKEEQETEEPKGFNTKELAECFSLNERALARPHVKRVSKVSATVHEAISCYQ